MIKALLNVNIYKKKATLESIRKGSYGEELTRNSI